MLKVSQNGNTIQHLSFLPSKKKQNISWSIWESTQAFLHFERNTQLVVFILKDEQLLFIQDKGTFHKENFHIDKEYISVNTKSKNTENNNVFILE